MYVPSPVRFHRRRTSLRYSTLNLASGQRISRMVLCLEVSWVLCLDGSGVLCLEVSGVLR